MSQQFEMVESCEVDDGSLIGLSPQQCFVLGVEWQMFRSKLLKNSGGFTSLIHAGNAERLSRMAERHIRFVEHSDLPNGWVRITVGGHRD